MKEHERFDGVTVQGHIGTWHSIEMAITIGMKKVWLLEHDEYGDEAGMLWVDENLTVILSDVWNGFLDLMEHESRS